MAAVVNGLLEQLSRLDAAEGVIVIGATNHPNRVDPAVIRSGRFDRKLIVGLPDREGIAAILGAHLPELPANVLAAEAPELVGLSGADLVALARQAKARARADRRSVTLVDLRAAMARMRQPAEPGTLRRICLHEAGHLLVAHLLGLPPANAVQVSPKGGAVLAQTPACHTRASADDMLAVYLAGRAAEQVVLGGPSSGAGDGPDSDLALATTLAARIELQWGMGEMGLAWQALTLGPEVTFYPSLRDRLNRHLREAEARAAGLLDACLADLLRISEVLEREREITGEAIAKLLPSQGNVKRPGDHGDPASGTDSLQPTTRLDHCKRNADPLLPFLI